MNTSLSMNRSAEPLLGANLLSVNAPSRGSALRPGSWFQGASNRWRWKLPRHARISLLRGALALLIAIPMSAVTTASAASPAVVGKELFLRGHEYLCCIAEK